MVGGERKRKADRNVVATDFPINYNNFELYWLSNAIFFFLPIIQIKNKLEKWISPMKFYLLEETEKGNMEPFPVAAVEKWQKTRLELVTRPAVAERNNKWNTLII